MKLHVLGSGSCIVSQERCSSGYLVESENDLVMVDSGAGTSDMLRRKGVVTDEIDAIINTHRHPDHISDLIPIIQDKVVRSFQKEESGIGLYGPDKHKDYLKSRIFYEMKENSENFDSSFGFNLEIGNIEKVSSVSGFDIDSFPADHGPKGFKCVSLKISRKEKTIFFTGDTDYFEDLAENASGADLIVADCSKPDEKKVEGHMTPTECAKLAEEAGADVLLLSHLYPEAEDSNLIQAAEKVFKGEIEVADDLMTLEI
jgi:ribonuclease BN (tRNA processing enzyme)